MKDVSLPVCHKSSVLLCDRLADRASSVSLGTQATVIESHFLRSSSHFPRQRERGREKPLVWCFGADMVKSC